VHELRELEAASTAKGARVRCVLYDTAASADAASPTDSSPSPPPAAAFSRLAAACLPCGTPAAVAEHSNRVQPLPHGPVNVKAGRIDRLELRKTLQALDGPVDGVPAAGPTTAFVCGPPKASARAQ
jgi:hypothetical protein